MGHWHSFDSHTHGLGGHRHGMIHRHEFSHYHQMNISLLVPSQTLNLPEHRHSVNIPAHAHDVTLPEHLHGIEYGIYSGPMTSAYTVEVDGKEVPAAPLKMASSILHRIFPRTQTAESAGEHSTALPCARSPRTETRRDWHIFARAGARRFLYPARRAGSIEEEKMDGWKIRRAVDLQEDSPPVNG